ncbi:hypothetical protein PFICI_13898 [Pestalotiopsis fici W106-1]|uniref:Heterokaryon incompatibility domain-containing protein n=1 Tax=Pestalotiopsis fici (strain W106-1 / CGMCC3.15140) TaxID=1229662 RepID=W3WLI1_PESFW|nr:uncharacterized protein PFICI_13898 [Pestalotiopsis fici W106-1]ETS74032.1 hypothetical protein PFICI_13898 [Pestalotiopsis fici W106-1]
MSGSDHLCADCQRLSLEGLKDTFDLCHDIRPLYRKAEASDSTRCDMCALVWRSLRVHRRRIPLDEDTYVTWPVSMYSERADSSFEHVRVLAARGVPFPMRIRSGDFWHYDLDEEPGFAWGSLTLYRGPGDSCDLGGENFRHQLVGQNAGAPDCLHLVSSWVESCDKSHGTVCFTGKARQPTRLIEVAAEDGSASLRLITSPAYAAERYVALSYCWGQDPTLRLEMDNISALHESINMENLPQTIQDAISLTRYLGIRYLWVDALCIIQGRNKTAKADWTRESNRMHDVYGGAWLTIVAAAGASSDAGLFVNRPAQDDLFSKGIRIPVESGKLECAVLGPALKISPFITEPLEKRGWAFQESIMSRRLLRYGTSGMSWKCHSCEYHENVTQPLQPSNIAYFAAGRKEMARQLHERWTRVVESYSATHVTYKSDRLPAIAGLAGIIRDESGIPFQRRYHFGVWEDNLVQQLLWRHEGCLINDKWVYERQTDYRAPSWSWASVDGVVNFLRPDPLAPAGKIETLHFKGSSLFFRGQMAWARSLRLQTRAQSTGLVETHEPWRHLDAYFDTYLDDLLSIPSEHKKTPQDGPQELINVWLLFLNKSQGLILAPSVPNSVLKLGDWKLVTDAVLSRRDAVLGRVTGYLNTRNSESLDGSSKLDYVTSRMPLYPKLEFRRIGVFSGSLSPSVWKTYTRRGWIV